MSKWLDEGKKLLCLSQAESTNRYIRIEASHNMEDWMWANIDRLVAIAEGAEWQDGINKPDYCPFCGRWESEGHKSDCLYSDEWEAHDD